jgi:hypothetical protein
MDVITAIRRGAPVLAEYGHVDQGILLAWLLRAGVTKEQALSIMRFVPLAFGRDVMSGMGVALPDTYIRMSAGGQQREKSLSEEPVFREALEYAAVIASEIGFDAFEKIALQSSELQAVNQALNAGAQVENLVASPPVVMLRDDESLDGDAAVKRPWWKLF